MLQCGGEVSCMPDGGCGRRPGGGPASSIDLPPELLCQRAPCGRAFGLGGSTGSRRCDPAGAVFMATLKDLGDLDRAALHFAGSGNVAAVRWLLLLGANMNCRDSNGTTLLHAACRIGSLQMVQELVKRGVFLDAADDSGWTALHVASCMGRQDAALCLLSAGATARRRNARGQTPEELCSHPSTKEVIVGFRAPGAPGTGGKAGAEGPEMRAPAASHRAVCGGAGGDEWVNTGLRFEPCFVPRDAAMPESSRGVGPREVPEELKVLAVDIFGRSPGHGAAFLVSAGVVRDYPVEINHFLTSRQACPVKFGEYLGEPFPLAQNLRLEILNSMPFLGTGVVSALVLAFREFAVPADYLRCDRLVQGIAHFWWLQHEEELRAREGEEPFAGAALEAAGALGEVAGFELFRALQRDETLHGLMFSALMLHRWLAKGRAMTLNEWTDMNADIEVGGGDVPMKLQTGIYHALAEGRRFASEQTPWPKVLAAPTIEGHAMVLYNGRAQVSHNGIPSEFPELRPRLLAARGGVSSSGTSSCATMDELLSRRSREDSESGETAEEAAWLSLHRWYLFFSPVADSSSKPGEKKPPYAFVSLKRIALRVIDTEERRLVLTSRGSDAKPAAPLGTAECCEEWLELCLLLADGRFQPMEAPRLQLRFEEAATFQAWAALLGEACADKMPTRPPALGPRISVGTRLPSVSECAAEASHTSL